MMRSVTATLFAALAYAATASAGTACIPDGILILPLPSYPVFYTPFILYARNDNGSTLPVTYNPNKPVPGTFFFPLSLGPANLSIDDPTIPQFQLSGGKAYSNGGSVLSTTGTPLLNSEPLYLAADSAEVITDVGAVNATCDGVPKTLLRFQNLLKIPLAGGIVNGTFTPGTGISSPLLEPLLGLALGSPIDLVIRFVDSTADDS